MFAYITNNSFGSFSTNPIIRYIHAFDLRFAIAERKSGERGTASYPSSIVGMLIQGLIHIVNHASTAEKTEFLQNESSRSKLFKIIGGLILFYKNAFSPDLPFHYLHDLLEVISLDSNIEALFYHSDSFTKNADLIIPRFSYEHELALHDINFSAIQKYPEINLTSLSRQNIQRHLSDEDAHDCIYDRISLMLVLKRLPGYLEGKLTNQDILACIPVTDLRRTYFDERIREEDLAYYASVLVTFMDEPAQLLSYFSNGDESSISLIEKIIDIEAILRSEHLPESLLFNGALNLKPDATPDERYHFLLKSLAPAAEHVQKWLPTHFLRGTTSLRSMANRDHKGHVVQPDLRVQYGLHRYLKQDTAKLMYTSLLHQGFSHDMTVRIALHDMVRPERLALSAKILNDEPLSATQGPSLHFHC